MSAFENRKEFRRLYAEYYPLVFSAAYVKTGNRQDAEDICHDVFVRFFNHFGEIEKYRGWLMKAVSFEISNYRSRRANRVSEFADIDDFMNDSNLAFVNGFRDSRIIIQEVLQDEANFENEREMLLFELIAVYDFSYREAGKYLDMTRWQAEYRYRKVSDRIIDQLRKRGVKGIGDLL
ncbi:MAG: sigma-70 family RNA polymerase sigma factor [Spirochaetes bacterium]|nr:sigma-70 family RNA polymerase sigma factor [Spirochaetota bacterium]